MPPVTRQARRAQPARGPEGAATMANGPTEIGAGATLSTIPTPSAHPVSILAAAGPFHVGDGAAGNPGTS
eukprot:3806206-Alexandrium_andersonii.AAC.1